MIKTVTITILSVLSLFVSVSAQDHIDIEFWSESGRRLLLTIDGHKQDVRLRPMVRNLSAGHHNVRLYEVRSNRSYYYGNRKKFLYAGSIFVKPDRSYGFVVDSYRRLHKAYDRENFVAHHVCDHQCGNPCYLNQHYNNLPYACNNQCESSCPYIPGSNRPNHQCDHHCGSNCSYQNKPQNYEHVCDVNCSDPCRYGSYYNSGSHCYLNGFKNSNYYGQYYSNRGNDYGWRRRSGYTNEGPIQHRRPNDSYDRQFDASIPPISNEALHDLKYRLDSEAMESEKRKLLEYYVERHHFLSRQVQSILSSFYFESSKLKMAKLLYPVTIDQDNFYQLSDVFTFESDKKRLLEWIESR